jgi:hypothetical protein
MIFRLTSSVPNDEVFPRLPNGDSRWSQTRCWCSEVGRPRSQTWCRGSLTCHGGSQTWGRRSQTCHRRSQTCHWRTHTCRRGSQTCRQPSWTSGRCTQALSNEPKVLSGAPRCSETYHNHSHRTHVQVPTGFSYSKGRPDCPPRV